MEISKKLRAAITAIEAYVPDYILTNEELSTMVDTSDEWIMSRVGIRERRILKGEHGMTFMAVKAVKALLEKNNVDPSEIGAIICSTVTPDMVFPSSASIIAGECGIVDAMTFDMNAACAGFIHALKTASLYIESGFCKKALIVSGEKMSSITDYTDRNTCPLFGDGAGAVLLEGRTDGTGLQDAILRTDGVGKEFLYMYAGGSLHPATHETVANRQHYIYQDGKNVFKWAVTKMADVSAEIMERNNLQPEDIAYLLPHQANLRIIDAVANRMGIDKETKVLINIDMYGNTSSATIPILIWDNQSKFKKGDNLIFSSFGAGFAWGSVWLKWSI
ncbi:MAG TPA: beta-ketoacyl-ACP synthase III [Paludibacteraceae bacterium]|nr:beta-ketoacyl-ACP synthase III [Paludibacteraceae bacterium]HOO24098.1 beta-ketoacyl-ACP synthase III [Paludibacteraceae bacterium]HOS37570.1 beta-ketoacyl-ACP synthase III [Paludibacteraceae bacterium]HPD27589.1 beta-ketoacyl-ACP synthase III [Paludibacteraceae bacterium]HPK20221.1 beta-ketoacyl-ACP synthase III [Paludibacteraceae bacterium]